MLNIRLKLEFLICFFFFFNLIIGGAGRGAAQRSDEGGDNDTAERRTILHRSCPWLLNQKSLEVVNKDNYGLWKFE